MLRVQSDRNLSRKLSAVFNDIGVNERVVRKRRHYSLLKESVGNLGLNFINANIITYNFGSQSEGATTCGLNSDKDIVVCIRDKHVIQDWADWIPGADNLLMVQDETTSPGYCLLQLLRTDTPQAATFATDDDYKLDEKGRILLKNTWIHPTYREIGAQVNGPAGTRLGVHGQQTDTDFVQAFYCETWPNEGRGWLDRQNVSDWPCAEIKRLAGKYGCLLVPVASKLNHLTDVEWRISTSMAERFTMFNLNITQIRCYVMLKVINKTFCTLKGQSILTSFMCKCTLLHCIETSYPDFWREENLYPCVMRCLHTLRDRVMRRHCPHYIIPTNNLMAGRINPDQQGYLMNVLDRLIPLNIDMLLAIEIDDIGKRIQLKFTEEESPDHENARTNIGKEISIVSLQAFNFFQQLSKFYFTYILFEQRHKGLSETANVLIEGIRTLQDQRAVLNGIEIEAYQHLSPLLCTYIGSVLAAYSVTTTRAVSQDAVLWLKAGFESDVSSGKLKLASAFLCSGDINRAEGMLRDLEVLLTSSCIVFPMCSCFRRIVLPSAYWLFQAYTNEAMLNKTVSYCVAFTRCEASIIPPELRHEFFRSTELEIYNRSRYDKLWMDLAVVDSLPFLYFLQYKVYKHLGHQQIMKKALDNLLNACLNFTKLGHRETAWNLLGQCLHQENMSVDAGWCYEKSLEIRPTNNAANFHRASLRL